jgi:hypothetical protein
MFLRQWLDKHMPIALLINLDKVGYLWENSALKIFNIRSYLNGYKQTGCNKGSTN